MTVELMDVGERGEEGKGKRVMSQIQGRMSSHDGISIGPDFFGRSLYNEIKSESLLNIKSVSAVHIDTP